MGRVTVVRKNSLVKHRIVAIEYVFASLIFFSFYMWSQENNAISYWTDTESGEQQLRALSQAFPDRIGDVSQEDGEWTVVVDETRFYWAHGRMLPFDMRYQWESFAPLNFNRYKSGPIPPLRKLDPEQVARLKERIERSEKNPPKRSDEFLSLLFRASTSKETWQRIVTVRFMDYRVQVHEIAAKALSRVAAECRMLVNDDRRIAAFFRQVKRLGGYNFRNVAGTKSRSYHGYGLAIDFIPASYNGKQSYWRWAYKSGLDWWELPYERRWMVPERVVLAFEKQGFVWGGKWMLFDTMHFEYRPELFILEGMRLEGGETE